MLESGVSWLSLEIERQQIFFKCLAPTLVSSKTPIITAAGTATHLITNLESRDLVPVPLWTI